MHWPSPFLSLLLFTLWSLLLVAVVVSWRSILVLKKSERANAFKSGAEHGSPLYWRINRAHTNSLETLVVFATLILLAEVVGLSPQEITHPAALVLLARIAQTGFHLSGESASIVTLRFCAFVFQLGALFWIGLIILSFLHGTGTL